MDMLTVGAAVLAIEGKVEASGVAMLEQSEGTNLPDHATSALGLLGRMERDRAEEFAVSCLQPALARMAVPLDNLFHDLLEAARQLIAAHFPPAAAQQPAVSLPVIAEGVLP